MSLAQTKRAKARKRFDCYQDEMTRPGEGLLFTGRVLVMAPPTPEEEQKNVRFRRKDALGFLALIDLEPEQLSKVARFFPRRALEHPAMKLLALTSPAVFLGLRAVCELQLARQQWVVMSQRLRAPEFQRMIVAALRRAQLPIDAELAPGNQSTVPEWSSMALRLGHVLEAVLEKQLSREDAKLLIRAGLSGGPAGQIVETVSEEALSNNREVLTTVTEAFRAVVGAPLKRRRRVFVRSGRRGAKASPALYALTLLGDLFVGYLPGRSSRDHAERTALLQWQLKAARAALKGLPIPLE